MCKKRGGLLALLIAVHGCGGGSGDAPEGACAKIDAAVRASLERWRALRKAEGSRYWYEEENCATNVASGAAGTVRTVQVGQDGAEQVKLREIERDECEAQVNRYEDFEPQTFEQLYATCKELVTRECDATFVTDDQGIVRTCTWDKDDNKCFDNCGQGFHIRRRGFGAATAD